MGLKARSGTKRFCFEQLADVMATCMLAADDARRDFVAVAASANQMRDKASAARGAHQRVFGWAQADDVLWFQACFAAYQKYFETIPDVWMLQPAIADDYAGAPSESFGSFEGAMQLLCGLELFGHDPSGDTAWLSTIASAANTTVVWCYDHEVGKVSHRLGNSFADMVASTFEPYGSDDDALPTWIGQAQDAFTASFDKLAAPALDAKELFDRSAWLVPLTSGETGYGFARDLGKAPAFALWVEEKSRLAAEPWLANYWLLAHYFLANEAACREAIALCEHVEADATRQLAAAVAAVLDGTSDTLAKIPRGRLDEIRAACAKNALPELLEAAAEETAAGDDTLSAEGFDAAISAGQDPFEVIAQFPLDMATHERALDVAAKADKDLADVIKRYRSERTDAAYNTWPYRIKKLERRLSIPVAAAFRSGLRYDADHDRAFAGVTKTLGMYDDDHAMAAFGQAIDELEVDDARLEYVIAGLAASKHAAAPGLLSTAAWRTFAALDEARKNQQRLDERREREGVTLDNMFGTQNHLLSAMRHVFVAGGDDAAKLADRLLEERDTGKILGRRVGDAVRVAGDLGYDQHAKFIFWYVEAVGKLRPDNTDMSIDDVTLENFGEAALAAAKLDGARARPILRELFDRATDNARLDVDIKAGTIGGLLRIDGKTAEYLGWIERLLGNRANGARITPTLRAVADAKLSEARDWVYPHVYSKKNDLMAHQVVIGLKAREAMAALGEADLPAFNEDTQYATRLKTAAELEAGFAEPENYWPSYICKRSVEKELSSPGLIQAVAEWTRSRLRYSVDNPWRADDDHGEGFSVLVNSGAAGRAALASFLDLEHIAPVTRAYIPLALRFSANEADAWARAVTLPIDDVLAQLNAPDDPEWLGFLDLLAARALVERGDSCRAAIENAMTWRYERSGAHHDNLGVDLKRLPLLLARCGAQTTKTLEALKQAHADNYYVDDFIDAAIAASKKPAPAAPASSAKLKLRQKQGDHGWTAKLSADASTISTAMDEIYLSFFKGNDVKANAPLPEGSLDRLHAMATTIGYT